MRVHQPFCPKCATKLAVVKPKVSFPMEDDGEFLICPGCNAQLVIPNPDAFPRMARTTDLQLLSREHEGFMLGYLQGYKNAEAQYKPNSKSN